LRDREIGTDYAHPLHQPLFRRGLHLGIDILRHPLSAG